ncbi:hypothetical protein [Bosea sp. UC22_33]|uniref:hypothetical protein n=1 Tax=Bosea sp. UC22_33 TaxID=3350165 RepID=UPI00366D8826
MKPDLTAQIARSNDEEVERAKEAATQPSTIDTIGDTVTQLDSLDQIVELGGVVLNGLRITGDCIAAVCDAIPSFD